MTQDTPKFTRINESFLCTVCGRHVPPASGTCRDHCPFCLTSLHVDRNPGDRSAECGGILKPYGYSQRAGKGWMIHYCCTKCNTKRINKFLEIDEHQADSFDALLALSGKT